MAGIEPAELFLRAGRLDRGVPSKAALEAAMLAHVACEASDLHEYAVGHMLAAELRALGLDTRQILEAFELAAGRERGDEALALSAEQVIDLVLPERGLGAWAQALLARIPRADEPDALDPLVHAAVLVLARDARDPIVLLTRIDAASPARVREVALGAAPQATRDAWMLRELDHPADDIESLWIALEELLPSLHLPFGPEVNVVLDATVARCAAAVGPEFRQTQFLVRGARMGKVYAPKRPTEEVVEARAELEEEYEPRRRIQRLPAIVRAAAKRSVAAGDARAIAAALGKGFEAKGEHVLHGPTKATFEVRGDLLIATKPLSETAIARLGRHEPQGGHRPEAVDLPDIVDALEKGPFRLPTEAEWEVARKPDGEELLPELLADPWDPKDPDGPRVVRRGAERLPHDALVALAFRPALTLIVKG